MGSATVPSHYNFARPHQTPTQKIGGYKTTPAMAAGVTNRVWTQPRHCCVT
jgi:hypothetical protein